jgi:signal transduction histidine kinase
MTIRAKGQVSARNFLDNSPLRQGVNWLKQLIQPLESADYQSWRHRFLLDRLRLGLWVAVPCYLTFVVYDIYRLFLAPAEFNGDITKFLGNPDIADRLRTLCIATDLVIGVLLVGCLILRRTSWGQRYPAILFLCFSWSVTLVPQIIGTLIGLPESGANAWLLVFLVQATLMPVQWRLHVLSQLGALAYYVGVNSMLGLTSIGGRSIYNPFIFVYLFWFCIICDLSVYLYERLQQAEFESRRDLRVFLHAVSHDLKTPVLATSIVLQNLLKKAVNNRVTINTSVLERLLQGSDRQISLINSLLEAHQAEVQSMVLHRQPQQLSTLVHSVVSDLEPVLNQNQIVLDDRISPDLPLINVDATQLWRVISNLITNALKHNPRGIHLSIDAAVDFEMRAIDFGQTIAPVKQTSDKPRSKSQPSTPDMLCCWIQDTGVGIPAAQCERLFELYVRGSRARYTPGLGLGLYLCRQIITAHGGQIGVISHPGEGSTFWFTLPLAGVGV